MTPYRHLVQYYETDRMGITHHSNYILFMEEARVDLMDQMGYGFERMEADGVVSPVTAIECNYKHSTTFQDEIEIEVQMIEFKKYLKIFLIKVTFTNHHTRANIAFPARRSGRKLSSWTANAPTAAER